MKNPVKLSFLLILLASALHAQDNRFKLGLRFAPGISQTRVQDLNDQDNAVFSAGSASLRFSAGLSGDFFFGRNYAFYSGLWYSVNNARLKAAFDSAGKSGSAESAVNIQTVQIPAALKLFTNEIATDARIYFLVGGTATLAIKKVDSEPFSAVGENRFSRNLARDAYSLGDVGLLLGAGVEYRLGDATTLFGGLTYNRGLSDMASKSGPISYRGKQARELYDISLGLICLEMGIYF